MKSLTYGEVNIDEIAKIISEFVANSDSDKFDIYVGTDSQNFSYTKMVLVIAVHCIGHGGIFFYEVKHVAKITSIKHKLMTETMMSIELADQLKAAFERLYDKNGFDYTNMHMAIHVDASVDGKSGQVINDISNYVHAYGYEFSIKPDSYAASSIANKISK